MTLAELAELESIVRANPLLRVLKAEARAGLLHAQSSRMDSANSGCPNGGGVPSGGSPPGTGESPVPPI